MRRVRPDIVKAMRYVCPEVFDIPAPNIETLCGAHAGETIFILAAGPSAAGQNFTEREKEVFRTHTTIRVNHPIDWLTPTYLLRWDRVDLEHTDSPYYPVRLVLAKQLLRWRRETSTKVICNINRVRSLAGILTDYVPDFVCYSRGHRDGATADALPVSDTTTTGAIWLATIMGAKRIIIIGFDLTYIEPDDVPKDEKGRLPPDCYTVAHDYDHICPSPPQGRFNPYGVNKQCDKLWRQKIRRKYGDVEIVNGNPESQCTVFPKRDIHEILAELSSCAPAGGAFQPSESTPRRPLLVGSEP